MAISQNEFSIYPGQAYEGQIATLDRPRVNSGIADDTVWFGRAVVRGAAGRAVKAFTKDSKAADVVGVSVRHAAAMSYDGPNTGNGASAMKSGYFKGQHVSYLRDGAIRVLCVDGAKAGDTVWIINEDGDNLGRFTHGKGIELNCVKWRDTVPAGGMGWIELSGTLSVSATPA